MLQTITLLRAPDSNTIGAWTTQAAERELRSEWATPHATSLRGIGPGRAGLQG